MLGLAQRLLDLVVGPARELPERPALQLEAIRERTRRRSALDLFAAAYLDYPLYFDPWRGGLTGFDAAADGIELKGAVRNLPAVSLYASYEDFGTYFGVRSGLMEFTGLQVVDAQGESWNGSGQSFLTGVLVGQAWSVAELNFYIEGAYTVRDFPSVEWSGSPPPETPRSIDVSGWSLGAGIQFGIGN